MNTENGAARQRFHTSRIWRRIFCMYCVLILVVLVTLVPVYREVVTSAQARARASYASLMDAGITQAEKELNNCVTLLTSFSQQSDFKKLALMSDDIPPASHISLYSALQFIKSLTIQSDIIRDVEIFFQNSDLHVTSSRLFAATKYYYGRFFSIDGMTQAEYSALQRGSMAAARLAVSPAESAYFFDCGRHDVYRCFVPIPLLSTLSYSCGAYMFIDKDALFAAIDPQGIGGVYMLSNGAGELLGYSGCTAEQAQSLLLDDDGGSFSIDGERYDMYICEGGRLGLRYYWLAPVSAYVQSGQLAMQVVLAYVCLAFAVGLIFSLILTKVQYAPIRRLRSIVDDDGAPGDRENEYAAFTNAFMAMKHNNESYRRKIGEMDRVIAANAFEKLLWGVGDTDELTASLSVLIPNMPERFRLVDVLLCPLTDCVSTGSADDYDAEHSVELISVMLSDIFPKYWDREIFIHPITGDSLVLVIPDDGQDHAAILTKLSNIRQYICRSFDVTVLFGISRICDGFGDIHGAFVQTRHLLKSNGVTLPLIGGDQNTVFFVENQAEMSSHVFFNDYMQERLTTFIVNGNEDAARKLILTLADPCPPSFDERAQLFYGIRSVILAKQQELEPAPDDAPGDTPPSFTDSSVPDELFERLADWCGGVCRQYAQSIRDGSMPVRDRILEYIADNYADPGLYGKLVASKFNLSEKYLYTYFKKQIGIGFAEYLEELRLRQAAELLTSSRMSVSEIAAKVGFNSHNTFYKAFKRVYNQAPSDFRAAGQGRAANDADK